MTTLSELENVIFNDTKKVTVLMVTEKEHFYIMKDLVRKVKKYQSDVPFNVLITRPDYMHSWKQKDSFHKHQDFPAVLFFTYEVWVTKKSPVYIIQGYHEVSSSNIQLALMAVTAKYVFMDEERFLSEIIDTKYQLPPKLVFVFSYTNPDSLRYFLTFKKLHKQLECAGALLELRLMDIGKRKNSLVFSRHINGTKINSFPTFVLFWQELTETYEIKVRQEIFKDLSNTDKFVSLMVKNGILKEWKINYDRNDHCIGEDYHECVNLAYPRGVCKANTTVTEDDYSNNIPTSRRQLKKRRTTGKRRKVGNLTVLTVNDWSGTIEASSSPSPTKSDSPLLSLVFFIVKRCRYCEMIMPQIEKISKTIKRSENAEVYLVNCSASPKICADHHIRGFPSLKLFRRLPWSHLGGCATDNLQQQNIALDYHRPFEPIDMVLEWFSNSSLPSVRKDFLLSDIPKHLNHDVYLVGTVITRSQALRFLPPYSHNKWYPYTCFQTACELLLGKAFCYVTMTRDFGISEKMRKTKNKDLFLIELRLLRSDGIEAKIFELGVPLERSLEENDSELHKFHNAHSYFIEKGFRCEDNHPRCTEFIVMFVRDHSRLPVTHLSHDGFHTINSDRSGQSEELPVVLVLAHKENLTSHSSYTQEINKAAYELYRDVIFTSLDVDEYPWWARKFVPRDYDKTQLASQADLEYTAPLHHYPRLCIVRKSDHSQAAFLPSLENMANGKNIPRMLRKINAQKIIAFVKRYLQNPQELLVITEEF
ncbi:uncharacterized protein LOC114526223 isoform X2 [Dendronephthya gigantea]|nr:uncharacterized protein LOC114526223 isoform X2 [Dendronephthya gigantea]